MGIGVYFSRRNFSKVAHRNFKRIKLNIMTNNDFIDKENNFTVERMVC